MGESNPVYEYRLTLLTFWQMSRAATRAQARPFLLVVSATPLILFSWMAWRDHDRITTEQLLVVVPIFVAFAFFISFLLGPATTLLLAIAQRIVNPSLFDRQTVSLSELGLRMTGPGHDVTLDWHAIQEVRLTKHVILVRTSQWLAIPRKAFPSAGESRAFFDDLESRRGLSDSTSAAPLSAREADPYAPPRAPTEHSLPAGGALPERSGDVIVRVVAPAATAYRLRTYTRVVRYRPRWLAPLAAMLLPTVPLMYFGDSWVLMLSLVTFPAAMWWAGRRQRRALRGVPIVTDLTATGVEQWTVVGRTRCEWAALLGGAEESDAFILYSRMAFFLLRKQDISADELPRLRALMLERLGHRAEISW